MYAEHCFNSLTHIRLRFNIGFIEIYCFYKYIRRQIFTGLFVIQRYTAMRSRYNYLQCSVGSDDGMLYFCDNANVVKTVGGGLIFCLCVLSNYKNTTLRVIGGACRGDARFVGYGECSVYRGERHSVPQDYDRQMCLGYFFKIIGHFNKPHAASAASKSIDNKSSI